MRALILVALGALAGCEKKPAAAAPGPDAAQAQPAPAAVAQTLVRHEPGRLFGGETGLDHVGVAVKDLDMAERAYTELGFGLGQRGTLPNGLKNLNYYFADNRYVELMTYWDKDKADWLARFLEKTEGANFVLFSVFSMDETRALLEAKGYQLGTTTPGRIDAPGVVAGTDPLWHTLFFAPPSPLPGGRVGFIAYRRDRREHTLPWARAARRTQTAPSCCWPPG